MLCISMLAGEYFTINDNIVVKLDHVYASRLHLTINAPREIPIVRGRVLERNGGERPACIGEVKRRYRSQLPWDRKKAKALRIMRETLAHMGDSPETQMLREGLEEIFPRKVENKPAETPSETAVM